MALLIHANDGWLLSHEIFLESMYRNLHYCVQASVPDTVPESNHSEIRPISCNLVPVTTCYLNLKSNVQFKITCDGTCDACNNVTVDNKNHEKILNAKPKKDMFGIRTPFLMDSAARKIAKLKRHSSETQEREESKSKKVSLKFFKPKEEYIFKTTAKIIQLGFEINQFHPEPITSEEWLQNNSCARNFVKRLNSYEVIAKDMCMPSTSSETKELGAMQCGLENRLVEYTGSSPCIVTHDRKSFLLPPHSSFLWSDIIALDVFINAGKKFDAILMDPPWENKSVKRKKGYAVVANEKLCHLPIPQLAKPGTLVLVWSTNNDNQISFIKNQLFPYWSVYHCADWYWVKVTQKGEPVYPFGNPHKKPFENLIIGRFLVDSHDMGSFQPVEEDKVLVSVPSAVHSHKPPLSEVLKPYLPEGAKGLELFARYLLPHWTSCGNEVLKLQNLDCFEQVFTTVQRV
ncbi:methyltransferase-like protein 4 isoform X2 [Limulus polyphemus]|uniref:Methyltransferase-like protein 4 isoform X2 n=1 Tax=Limulus polyphemus TaxID=6850 RepID=A0ABM1SX27_LIMPO|nr:methyltransferase-like protein 4 isoform X2 [Limulus polyphemus]